MMTLDRETIGIIGIVVMLILLALRMPIGIAMLLVGITGFAWLNGLPAALSSLGNAPYSYSTVYDLAVIPLFVLMGNCAAVSGMSRDLYAAAYAWLGHLRGGLASATIAACAGFAAVSGSSIASAVTMGRVCLPEMKRYKYSDALATGTVAAGGTLGILIPPSTAFVIYAILTEQSIGRLLLAGFLPGLLLSLLFILTIMIWTRFKPEIGPPGERASREERVRTLIQSGPMMAIVAISIGGIYVGAFTPSEAAAVGAFLSFALALWRRTITWDSLSTILIETVKTTAFVFLILIGAFVFGPFLALSGLPEALASRTDRAGTAALSHPVCPDPDLHRARNVPRGLFDPRADPRDRDSDRRRTRLRPDLVWRDHGDRAGDGPDQSAGRHQRVRGQGTGSGCPDRRDLQGHHAILAGDGRLYYSADPVSADRTVTSPTR